MLDLHQAKDFVRSRKRGTMNNKIIFSNANVTPDGIQWLPAEAQNNSIYYLPEDGHYKSAQGVPEFYKYVLKSGTGKDTKVCILLVHSATAYNAIAPDWTKDAKYQRLTPTLIGRSGTFKTSLSRVLSFPRASNENGRGNELTQEMSASERRQLFSDCNCGSVISNDLRRDVSCSNKHIKMLNNVLRDYSDGRGSIVSLYANGEPSFIQDKNLEESTKERLLIFITDSLATAGSWVQNIPDGLISQFVIGLGTHLENHPDSLDAYKKQFLDEAKRRFSEFSAHGKPRIKNYCFFIYFVHRMALEILQQEGWMPASECECCRTLLKESLYSIYQRQVAFVNTDECAFESCIAYLSPTIRLVTPRPFCMDDKLCSGSSCPYYDHRQQSCRTPRKELVLNELAIADHEGGVAFYDSDIPSPFSNLHRKNGRILLVVSEDALFDCYRKATEDICEQTQISVRPLNFTQFKRSLSDQGLLLYEERNRIKDQRNYTINWCSYELSGQNCHITFASSSRKFLVLYIPRQWLRRLCEDDRIIHAKTIIPANFPFIETLTSLRQVFVSTTF